ncbi:YkgJ family cysteine cluster protein [Pseudodesulfovibrio sp.]|uniref:YkgJ family cysteine cluster protein n=1 Tax=unclassified Pseudodesulfovibrio TaxID=2661612 RepID=UPI003AFF9FC2
MSNLRTFTGWYRRLRAFILRRDVEVLGQCAMCGDCCHDIIIRDGKRWLKSRRAFEKLCEKEPDHRCLKITGRDFQGHLVFACSLLGKDGLCTAHESRLSLCRNYPSKSLYYQGGWLKPDCGYFFKTFTFRDFFMQRKRRAIPKFSEVLRKETERRQDERQAP